MRDGVRGDVAKVLIEARKDDEAAAEETECYLGHSARRKGGVFVSMDSRHAKISQMGDTYAHIVVCMCV